MGRVKKRRKVKDPVYTPPTAVRNEAMGGATRRSHRIMVVPSEIENNTTSNSINVEAAIDPEDEEVDDSGVADDGVDGVDGDVVEADSGGDDGIKFDFFMAVGLLFAMANGDGNEFDYLTSVGLIHELINVDAGNGGGIDFLATLALIDTMIYGDTENREPAASALMQALVDSMLN